MEFTPQDGTITAIVSALVGWIIYLLRQGAGGNAKAATSGSAIRILRKVAYDLNDTFKRVGKGVVGTEMCPPPPQ